MLLINQTGYSYESCICGFVKDKKTGEPIQFAHIFIANTSKGTTSDKNGQFRLENIPYGNFTLVCSIVGYESYIRDMNLLPDEQIKLVITLQSSVVILDEIELVAKADKKWEKAFKEFKRELLGNTPNAVECKIVNPWVVDFEKYRRKRIIKAQVNQPLIINNHALGYQISFLISRFEKEKDHLFYLGYPSFDVLDTADSSQLKKFQTNREKTFRGSLRHFFYALVNNRLKEEGFMAFRISSGYENIHLESLQEALNNDYFNPLEISQVVSELNPWGICIFYTENMVEVMYTGKEWKDSPYFDAHYQVSRIVLNDLLEINQYGYVFNPYDYVVNGYLSEERLANMLPFEYCQQRSNTGKPVQ